MSKTCCALLLLLMAAIVKAPLDTVLEALLPSAEVNWVPECVAGALLSLSLLGIPAWRLRPWTSPRLLHSRFFGEGIALGILAALLARVSFAPVDAAWQAWLGIVPAVLPVRYGDPALILFVVLTVILPALTEEIFFRGALLTSLLDGSRRMTAVIVTTLAFALMHGNAAYLPSHLALSLMLTLLMLHTGRLTIPVAAHLAYNLSSLGRTVLPEGLHVLGCVIFGVLCGVLLVRQPKIAHLPMKRQDGLIAATALAVMAVQYFV